MRSERPLWTTRGAGVENSVLTRLYQLSQFCACDVNRRVRLGASARFEENRRKGFWLRIGVEEGKTVDFTQESKLIICSQPPRQRGDAGSKQKRMDVSLFSKLTSIGGAGGRTRTDMVSRRILSAVRLPIPPHRRIFALCASNNRQYSAF